MSAGQTPDRLVEVTLDDSGLAPPTPEVERERKVALFDLMEENFFRLPGREDAPAPQGPYRLRLAVAEGRLVFEVATEGGGPAGAFILSLSPFRQVIKDYFAICASYFDAVKRLPPAQIEAIDMGRRGIHNEGSTLLLERLKGKVETDHDTARRLFTLICVLHFKG
ncbi:UPF0262 family protein [Rubrimonas cliftonensis]|uniref:UPF0262 protein SAMN05444370_101269 n=1 Tax=Rubrimonas cliftonensis TaxID=89524 RepID=A0A1H3VQX3_9RHOB|nr:UPF0262 family protein [Rubrimonas cliftonensis]SDZ77159.1 Uncharacterized protein, UPF0262 family [Rubrimonas cliftonensis]